MLHKFVHKKGIPLLLIGTSNGSKLCDNTCLTVEQIMPYVIVREAYPDCR